VTHLVTGGAGFIGRWVVKRLLAREADRVVVVDNFSNSSPRNLAEFAGHGRLRVVEGDISDGELLARVWKEEGAFETVYHLAASIRVQDSIDDPRTTFHNDVVGTFEVLECCRRQYLQENGLPVGKPFHLLHVEKQLTATRPRVVFMSTCMVYDRATQETGIDERHPTRPASPYGASKIAAENLVLSYFLSYRLPAKVIRPFNTYGPFQKSNLEGGVVAIFIGRDLAGKPLLVKGDGLQTRDLLYVEDCARFVVEAGLSAAADGEVMNAGSGRDISIRGLAALITDKRTGGNGVPIQHIPHDHPQAEIAKLLCDSGKASRLLGWQPKITLEEGIRLTREWIRKNPEASL